MTNQKFCFVIKVTINIGLCTSSSLLLFLIHAKRYLYLVSILYMQPWCFIITVTISGLRSWPTFINASLLLVSILEDITFTLCLYFSCLHMHPQCRIESFPSPLWSLYRGWDPGLHKCLQSITGLDTGKTLQLPCAWVFIAFACSQDDESWRSLYLLISLCKSNSGEWLNYKQEDTLTGIGLTVFSLVET